jgi:hypothetical protein
MGLLEAVKNVVKGAATLASAISNGNQGYIHGSSNTYNGSNGLNKKDKMNIERREFSSKEVQTHAELSEKSLKENGLIMTANSEKSTGFKQQSSVSQVSQNSNGGGSNQYKSVNEPTENQQAKSQKENIDRDR